MEIALSPGMTNTNKSERNWVVVVDVAKDGTETYLGAVSLNADIYNGPSVKEYERCGCKRIENALRFTQRGAQRLSKGYTGGAAKQVS